MCSHHLRPFLKRYWHKERRPTKAKRKQTRNRRKANTSGNVQGDSAYRSAEIEAKLRARGLRSRFHTRRWDHPEPKQPVCIAGLDTATLPNRTARVRGKYPQNTGCTVDQERSNPATLVNARICGALRPDRSLALQAEGQPARLARHARRMQLVEQVRLRKFTTHGIMQFRHPGHVMASPISRARSRWSGVRHWAQTGTVARISLRAT
jgi:hypothetical protein